MRSISAEDFDSRTLPSRISNEGGVSYVVPTQPEADQVLAAFRTGAPLDEIPSEVRVEVQNGGAAAGAAAAVGTVLGDAGYDIVRAINSDRGDYLTTLVVARPSRLPAAERIVETLGYGTVVVGQTPEDADVVVIVGSDARLD